MVRRVRVSAMSDIAILGLGIIGSGVANHLASQGISVTVWNRTPKPEFTNSVATLAEAAQASTIISLYLKDRTACHEVLDALAPFLTSSHIILNHSTIDLSTVKELAQKCAQIGCAYLDAPFTGSRIPAQNGTLNYYVSGDPAILDQVRPLLEASSQHILYAGELGKGTVLKLVTNLLSATMVQGLSEALAITKSQGLTVNDLLEAMKLNVVMSPLAAFKLPYMDKQDFSPHFSLDNMRKDSTYAIELAEQAGIEPPMIKLVSELMTKLCQEGLAQSDFCALAGQFSEK
jgi:3-hydroxyisobutyrate dehydrogenase/glyoxylate/succinic semialdehyde reductase